MPNAASVIAAARFNTKPRISMNLAIHEEAALRVIHQSIDPAKIPATNHSGAWLPELAIKAAKDKIVIGFESVRRNVVAKLRNEPSLDTLVASCIGDSRQDFHASHSRRKPPIAAIGRE